MLNKQDREAFQRLARNLDRANERVTILESALRDIANKRTEQISAAWCQERAVCGLVGAGCQNIEH